MSHKTAVRTKNAPTPGYAFSAGIQKNGILQISGQGPQDPATGSYVHAGDVYRQTIQTLHNVRAVVEAAGGTCEDLIGLRVFLRNEDDFSEMNEAYATFVDEFIPSGIFPARTTVFTGLPKPEMLVEIDGLAILG